MDKALRKEIWDGRKTEVLADASKYNEGIREGWIGFWTKNAAENYSRIKEMFKKENCDVSVMRNEDHRPVLIIGSGPSLNDWEPYFKDWDGDIYVSSSHLAYFEAIGVKPTACFIIDADPNMSFLVGEADTKDITLVTHANMDPEVLKLWQGPVRFFRMNDPGDDWFGKYMPMIYSEFTEVQDHGEVDPEERNWGGAHGEFKGNRKVFPGIKTYVLNSGNVSNTMIALSQYIGGTRNVFLCGVDLGFPDGKYRFDGYGRTKDGFERIRDTGVPPERATRVGHNGVRTDQVSCFYKYSTLILWGMDGSNLYSCSRGILTEVPYISPKDVVACQGDVPDRYVLTEREKYSIAQRYLMYRGIFIMKGLGKVKTKPNPNYNRSKKRIIRYSLFGQWIKGGFKLDPGQRKAIIHSMYPATMLKFRLRWWEWTFTQTETKRARLGYTSITNSSHVKGIERLKVIVKFHIGRLMRLW